MAKMIHLKLKPKHLIGIALTVVAFFMIGTGAVMYATEVIEQNAIVKVSIGLVAIGFVLLAVLLNMHLYKNT